MAKVEVPRPRSSIEDLPGMFRISIPSKKDWFLILFIGFWMCGWLAGEVFALSELLRGRSPATPHLFLFGWLGAWTVGGGFVGAAWLWNAVGKEEVTLTDSALTIRRNVLGFGPLREYDLANVCNIRFHPNRAYASYWTVENSTFAPWFGGSIAFDYGARTFRFGAGLDEAEAQSLVETLKSRHVFE